MATKAKTKTETDGEFEQPAPESENPAPEGADNHQAMPEQSKGNQPDTRIRFKSGPRWVTCGSGWFNKDGSMSIALNSLPVPTNGSYQLVAFRIERDEQGRELRLDRETGELVPFEPRGQAA